jgi:hypothetical protein
MTCSLPVGEYPVITLPCAVGLALPGHTGATHDFLPSPE